MTEAAARRIPDHVSPDRVYDLDIYWDPELTRDIHVAYARLHGKAPDVFWTPANGGHWIVTRHDAITNIVMDYEHFSVREMQIPRIANPPRLIPLNVDPPESVPYRQMLAPFFSPRAVNAMTGKITQRARDVVATVAGRGHCDFVEEVAARFPVSIFLELMGLPAERLGDYRVLAERFFKARDGEAIHAAAGAITVELVKSLEQARAAPSDSLMSHLVTVKVNDHLLSMDELIHICMLLFFGGLDTVTNASSFTAQFLALNPGMQDRLLADPELMEPFVEEGIRMFGVVNTPRIVAKDCERFGVKFRVGDMVLCNLPLAGWDENKNPNPGLFDIDRKKRSYLTFSTGPHLCLGHFLARVEMRALFSEWMRQVGRYSVAPGFVPHYRPGTVMALEKLDLAWTPKLQS